MRRIALSLVLAGSLALAPACANTSNTTKGATIGAVGGAVAGRALTSGKSSSTKTAGTLGGALLGGVIGGIIGSNADEKERAAAAVPQHTQRVTVPNSDGTYTTVTLERVGARWKGPRGEMYETLPTADDLARTYAR